MSRFAVNVKNLRGSLSQRAFAKNVGVSQSTICAWEKGRNLPHIHNLQSLFKDYEVDLLHFLY